VAIYHRPTDLADLRRLREAILPVANFAR
jgi:hypothetical protein